MRLLGYNAIQCNPMQSNTCVDYLALLELGLVLLGTQAVHISRKHSKYNHYQCCCNHYVTDRRCCPNCVESNASQWCCCCCYLIHHLVVVLLSVACSILDTHGVAYIAHCGSGHENALYANAVPCPRISSNCASPSMSARLPCNWLWLMFLCIIVRVCATAC